MFRPTMAARPGACMAGTEKSMKGLSVYYLITRPEPIRVRGGSGGRLGPLTHLHVFMGNSMTTTPLKHDGKSVFCY